MAQVNPYPLRIDRELMEKFKVLAAVNGRSVNKEIEIMVKAAVAEYEGKNGLIAIPDAEA